MSCDRLYCVTVIMLIFIALSLWHECKLNAKQLPTLRPSQPTWAVSPPVGCHHLHPLLLFIIITQLKGWYLFYRPTESRRLSRPRRLATYREGPHMVTHPSTNRTRRRVTTLMEISALPLSHATTFIIRPHYDSESHQLSHWLSWLILTLWHSLLPYGYSILGQTGLSRPSFVIFDIQALWCCALSVRVPGCQKLQMMDGLTRSGTGCFIAVPIWQQWASNGWLPGGDVFYSRLWTCRRN